MTARYLVAPAGDTGPVVPGPFAGRSQGFTRWAVVGEAVGAAHTGFGLCTLEPGGRLDAHVHSFEQSVFVLEGRLVLDTAEGSVELGPGDYGLVPVGVAHAARNPGPEPARWADMCAPQPRARFDDDTFFVPSLAATDPANMDPGRQTQDQLAVSASMRTALLVYSGISVKMMVDSDLGAQLQTMFMVQYEPGGVAGTHDHPLEETYLVLEGEVDASFDGDVHRLRPGDVAWAGVGCVHGFSNPADRPVRWLETQAPQPPARHSYRFTRDWDYLRDALA
jgi:quercetin dioxygenase-like cupin family protein